MTGANSIPSPFLAEMAKAVRRARLARGWTRRDLAHVTGISVSTIGRVERHETEVRINAGSAIIRALGLQGEEGRWPLPCSRRWRRLVGPLRHRRTPSRRKRATA